MKHLITLMTLILLIVPMVQAQDDTTDSDSIIMYVSPLTQPCVGVAPQDCLIISTEDESSLLFFYDSIEGFEYEAGYQYTLNVRVSERENVPADASSLQYELIDIISQYPADITNQVWQLQSLNGFDIDDPTRYELRILDDAISIKADCNQVGATIEYQPFSLMTTFSTMALCPEDSLEMDYLDALNAVTLIGVQEGILILQSSAGQLRFAPPALENTSWSLESAQVDGEEIELSEDVVYDIQFEDALARMTLACNGAGASYTVDGGEITFGEVERQEELCEADPLYPIFPPEIAVYHITEDGQLVLNDRDENRYQFTPSS